MFFTYILVNRARTRTYCGQTDNLNERVERHNKGYVRSTKGGGPWELLYVEEHASRAAAMERERWFKNRTGRRKIKEMILERWPSG